MLWQVAQVRKLALPATSGPFLILCSNIKADLCVACRACTCCTSTRSCTWCVCSGCRPGVHTDCISHWRLLLQDIKPENLYLDEGNFRIGDFGIAISRFAQASITRSLKML